MTSDQVLRILQEVARGAASPQSALSQLAWLPMEALSDSNGAYARLDHHRALRSGHPEVVFGAGKTTPQMIAICERLAARDGGFFATRVEADAQQALSQRFPQVELNPMGRTAHLYAETPQPQAGFARVVVACAGTSDLAVAEEAAATARALGNPVERMYDVGVAGLHRLLQEKAQLDQAGILIVVAGMEGALPSVIGGLVKVPIIAVPTSIGYGASFGGVAALLAMLNSCAAGVTVVNIDNGFGAACAATRINQLLAAHSA